MKECDRITKVLEDKTILFEQEISERDRRLEVASGKLLVSAKEKYLLSSIKGKRN